MINRLKEFAIQSFNYYIWRRKIIRKYEDDKDDLEIINENPLKERLMDN